ncbi:hypothetical protein CA265_12230 [Sphingobacteriaceae bacterium GW460-11-11-14-LB5]|nr:hypothetical protein CA265_12230 [Sphingobacteriaceae bacterium GW460-11-11-14-LB5]
MSAYINVYADSITDDLIPEILKRLNEHEKKLTIEPVFSLRPSATTLSITFVWDKEGLSIFNGVTLNRTFKISIKSFELKEFKQKILKDKIVNNSYSLRIRGMFGKKKKKFTKLLELSSAVEVQLQHCHKVFSIKYHHGDVFEKYHATLLGAVITEITGGICHFTHKDIWYDSIEVMKASVISIDSIYD